MNPADQDTFHLRAAAYLRVSTDHQQYSICAQLEVIREFARQRGLELVKVYADEGKSGLRIQGRAALSQMIQDVLAKNIQFAHILVYDVSRWGRFQDADESAHYEFLCRQAGVTIHYCAELFENDGGLASSIAKNFKRAMAGEFSRELSVKAFRGSCRMARLGYKQGGSTVYGLRRLLVDQQGQPKVLLQPGDQKSVQTDRVVFVPGPEDEIKVVRWIFETFVTARPGPTELARRLNQQGTLALAGRLWTECQVRTLLRNEKYIGNVVYARRSGKLGRKRMANPPDQWIRGDGAFAGIVPREQFYQAQVLFDHRHFKYKFTEAELLAKLRGLLARQGHLSQELIDEADDMPAANTYLERFGSLVTAYQRIGYPPPRPYRLLNRRLEHLREEMIKAIQRKLESVGASAVWNLGSRELVLNQELRVQILFLRHDAGPAGTSYWRIHNLIDRNSDLRLVVRMDRQNEAIQDYYLLPGLAALGQEIQFNPRNGIYLDAYRFQTLDFLVSLAARKKIKEAA